MSLRVAVLPGLAAALLAAAFAAPPAVAADGPPACARINFRPLPSGQNDGEQEAGLYTSRFNHIELKATVKSGEPQDYYVTARNKKLAPLPGAVPAAAVSCAKTKNMPAPGKPGAACTGERFATVISSTGKEKVVLLYALKGKEWNFCSASTLPAASG